MNGIIELCTSKAVRVIKKINKIKAQTRGNNTVPHIQTAAGARTYHRTSASINKLGVHSHGWTRIKGGKKDGRGRKVKARKGCVCGLRGGNTRS